MGFTAVKPPHSKNTAQRAPNGVSEQDYIDFGQLSKEHGDNNNNNGSNNACFDSDPNYKEDNKTCKESNQFWKRSNAGRSLIDDLKEYGVINHAIKEEKEELDRIGQQIGDSVKQKQEIWPIARLPSILPMS
jgi:hypothetical protein